ncbi:thiamine phosphate synthase [Qipengyuania marisflavi]|uniref:Thiamine phosphate synthase n=1 Tax=Qipengyuania marisflavi TaxID=2486356 RepID=A0A5S3P5R8_9SPHN|nr:thiamine phosphate synthase [Qipengyuania marisflavi]TMM48390.1 thiamine phosphate synthase [Qipengyuania marisflavi]
MSPRQSLPLLWLLSDARNDAVLENGLQALPKGSGFVFRHYHLDPAQRARRFGELADLARKSEHLVIMAGEAGLARSLGADGIYGSPAAIADAEDMLRLAAAHDGAELQAAEAAGADGVFLSPVFPTRSHPGGATLGVHGFQVLAQQSPIPIIALGGMTHDRAEELAWPRWGAIDGLS